MIIRLIKSMANNKSYLWFFIVIRGATLITHLELANRDKLVKEVVYVAKKTLPRESVINVIK